MIVTLRVRVPGELTDTVVAACRGHVGTAEVAVARGASVHPPGDVVEVQVAREAADRLLEELEALKVPELGSITAGSPELVLSSAADDADAAAPGEGADAVIWDEVSQRTGEDSRLTLSYIVFLVAATHLAGIGIVTNSTIAIVGAMVVGPEFGPLAALAVAVVERKWRLARQAALALGLGFPLAMLTVAAAAAVSVPLGLYDPEQVRTSNSAVEFIYHPGPYSLIVAAIAGTVGMLSLISRKSSVLVGVVISVTTVPSAGFVAVALVLGEVEKAALSAAQLGLNLLGIVVAAVVVLLVYGAVSPKLPRTTALRLARRDARRRA
ncbi:DUF389 domain-containing protein [Sinomonas mesophila]|uniref:DUF389 domain-containing protein n=1 Tax=Sinomonas mesophila TaxID=1531955 RepID=UPI0009876613|nr:DUF389 domain-containing protein [Sinomonas mesophila]